MDSRPKHSSSGTPTSGITLATQSGRSPANQFSLTYGHASTGGPVRSEQGFGDSRGGCTERRENISKRRREGRNFVFGAAFLAAALFLLAATCVWNTTSLFHSNNGVNLHRILEGNGDDAMNDDSADNNDDAQNEEGQGNDDAQAASDDAANDDAYSKNDHEHDHDDTPIYVVDDLIDDFYAFQEDPGPPTLLPITANKVAGLMLAAMGATLAAGGGIGGGGIFVPVYIVVMQLPIHLAIPLSAVTVMGGAMASTLVNFYRRHPIADRPIIDWDIILVMQPLILMGALIGTLLHRVLSEQILVVMLVLFLTITARAMLTKARKMYDAETKYIAKLETAQSYIWVKREERLEQISENMTVETPLPDRYALEKQRILISNPDCQTLRSDLLEQEKVNPREKIVAIIIMFLVLIFLNVMVGGGGFVSPWGIRCGGIAFWVVHVIIAACLVACAWSAQIYLVNRHEIKELVNFDFVHGDIRWDARSSVIYPLFFCSAGLCAGLFGIGGGMVTVPLLLAMGVHPAVTTATSSCMTFFTSASATTAYVIYGLVMYDYAAVCLVIGFSAALFGQMLMARARSAPGGNFERNSLIAFSIGGVILLSAFLMTILYVLMIVSFDDDGNTGGICEGYARVAS